MAPVILLIPPLLVVCKALLAVVGTSAASAALEGVVDAVTKQNHEKQLQECLERAFKQTKKQFKWSIKDKAAFSNFKSSLVSFAGTFEQDSLRQLLGTAIDKEISDLEVATWIDNLIKQITLDEHNELFKYLMLNKIIVDTNKQSDPIFQPDTKISYILTSSASIYDNPEIICRDAFIDDLLGLLLSGHKRIQITGMGGLGKTEVLKKVYAKLANAKEKSKFDHIAYIQFNGEISDDIEAQIDYPNQYKGLEGINASNLFLHDICLDKNVLLCIDDVRTTAELVNAEHPCISYLNSLGAKVFLASRVIFPTFEEAPLELLSTDSCIAIFEKGYGRSVTKQNELDVLKAIIETRAGNHTLVVSRLSSMASEYEWSVLDLSKKLSEQNFNIATDISDDTEFQNEINKLYLVDEKLTKSEKNILTAFSIFPAIPLTYDLCVDWLHEDAKLDRDLCALALNKLSKKTWLIKQNGSNEATPFYSMHSIVNAAVQSQLRKEKPTLPHMVEHITSTVFNLLDIYDLSGASELIPFASSIVLTVVFDVDAYYALSCVIADYYYKTANYKVAEAWYRFTLDNLTKSLVAEHPFIAITENNLASVLHVQGNLNLSLDLYLKSLAVFEKQPEKDIKTISTIRSNIATIYSEQDKLDLSIEWFLKCLSVNSQDSAADKQDVAETLSNMAGVYCKKGERELSREYYEKANLIYEEMNMTDHPRVAQHYNNFATLCLSEGNEDEALSLLLKALDIRERVFGANHPETASTYNNVSTIYEKKGEFDKALSYIQKAQKVCERVYGRMNVHTAITYNTIGRIHRKLGEYQLALDWHQNAIAIFEIVAIHDQTNLGVLYSNLADVFFDLEQYDSALEWYNKAAKNLKNTAYPSMKNIKYVEDRITEARKALNVLSP